MDNYRSDIIRDYAEVFYETSHDLVDELMKLEEDKKDSLRAHSLVTVAATNITLAVELSLKALHAILSEHNEPIRGHDLVVLFEKLPSGMQKVIEVKYQQLKHYSGGLKTPFVLIEGDVNEDKSSQDKYTDDLMSVLRTHRNGFVDWRYNFEKPKESTGSVILVDFFSLKILYNVLAEIGHIDTKMAIAKMEFAKQHNERTD